MMSNAIWVLAEEWRGEISESSFEMLALGRELADGLGASLVAVLVGPEAAAKALGAADSVLVVDHPGEPTGEAQSAAIAALVGERRPRALLVGLTNVSWDVAGLLPARAGVPFVNFCRDLVVADGGLVARCLVYGGKMEVTVPVGVEPVVLGVLPGIRPAEAGRLEGDPQVDVVPFEAGEARVRFQRYHDPEIGDVDVTQQEVLIAVGRGIENEANIEVAEELATALGGAVCGSRPVIDQGWLPLDRQIGKSGATVKPRLYVAAGISGAPEHVEGMRDAGLILAINTDPDAPIFRIARYGVVADATDVLEMLAERVRAAKGG
jgi:electron transfer flavoprotein alpha subunit